jgi:hypothetical protein
LEGHDAIIEQTGRCERRPAIIELGEGDLDPGLMLVNWVIAANSPPRAGYRRFKGFVRTGNDAAGSKNRSCAQVVSRTLSAHASARCDRCRKYRDSDLCSDACRERASHARHAGVRQAFTEAAARSASRVHLLPPAWRHTSAGAGHEPAFGCCQVSA